MTSGASDTIFMNFLSRNSRATGPNTRVPTGSLTSFTSTAAFESKRIYVPSLRRVSLRIRTITQRTTFPFLIAESGAASFTEAVTMSPRPARNPRSPPRGRIHASRRAPLLSATSKIVRIPIIRSSRMSGRTQPTSKIHLDFHVQILGLRRLDQSRLAHHFPQPPPLQLAQRTAFDDPHDISHMRR